ncbi:MAG: hypothetical protein K1X75_01455 [Leptospirales bacterium]|nr:hypothetical protein [Leptospirales bacterium]
MKNKYRNYDTKHALRRMQAFRRAVQQLEQKGYPTALEILGSINFGLVEPYSDADCIILHYCDLHAESGECPLNCPNLQFEKEEIARSIARQLQNDSCKMEILDCINLEYLQRAVDQGGKPDEGALYRFMFYRMIGRPVNRPLFIPLFEVLEQNADLMRGFQDYAAEALSLYLKTSDHRHSFRKYNERILSRGLDLPDDLIDELIRYLS